MDAAPVDDDVARNEAPDIPFHDPRIEGFNREDRAATLKLGTATRFMNLGSPPVCPLKPRRSGGEF